MSGEGVEEVVVVVARGRSVEGPMASELRRVREGRDSDSS